MIIIFFGLLFLLEQSGLPVNFEFIWPLFLLVPGVFFFYRFFYTPDGRKQSGILIPATILTVYALYFFFSTATAYRYSGESSFIFPFGVALGLFATYHYSTEKRRGQLTAAWVLTAVSGIVLFSTIGGGQWWPLVLIVIGLMVIFQKDVMKKKEDSSAGKN